MDGLCGRTYIRGIPKAVTQDNHSHGDVELLMSGANLHPLIHHEPHTFELLQMVKFVELHCLWYVVS